MGATYLCGIVVCALLLPFVVATRADLGAWLWVLALIPAGLAMLHPAVLGRVFRLCDRYLGKGARTGEPTFVQIGVRHRGRAGRDRRDPAHATSAPVTGHEVRLPISGPVTLARPRDIQRAPVMAADGPGAAA